MRSLFFLVAFLFSITPLLGQDILLNEVMAVNGGSVLDGEGETLDWIELYNGGGSPIDLNGYGLSDDIELPGKHILSGPADQLTIAPQGHLLLWASGDPDQGPLHLNFSVSSEGETIILSSPSGTMIDLVILPAQVADVSYGRVGDGQLPWAFFDPPTPGSANATNGLQAALPPPQFSVAAGIHSGPLSVSITHPDPAATILYSLDGSRPEPALVDGETYPYKNIYPAVNNIVVGNTLHDTLKAFVYSGPITVQDISSEPDFLSRRNTTMHPYHPTEYMPVAPVRKATIIRARAYKEGHLPSEVITNTYLITADGTSPYELPILSIATEKSNLFSHTDGIYNAGIDYEQWRISDPTTLADAYTPANWTRSTEFPLSIEWFNAGGTDRTFQRDAGFRIHGSYSALFRRKSLRLYFRGEYGDPELDHAIFPSQDETRFKRLIVHTSGNDDISSNMRDMTLQAITGHMNFETQDGRPAVLFIDGEFWGVHGIRERYDSKHFERVFGLAEEQIDLVEKGGHASMGDSLSWAQLIEMVQLQDPQDPAVFDQLRTMIDMENHTDYHVAQVYIGNFDWPHTNWKAFRKRTGAYQPDAPYGHDGRWRWLLFDTDWGFNMHGIHPANADMLEWASQPFMGYNAYLFHRLLRNEEYRHGYINRAADMLNTAFRPVVVSGIIDHYSGLIEHDMQEHVLRWPDAPGSFADWQVRIDTMHAYGNARQAAFRSELQTFFELPAQHQLQIDVSDENAGFVKVNTIDLLPSTHGIDPDVYPWTGVYFEEVPVRLTAEGFPGWEFSHWEGDLQGTDSIASIDLSAATSITAVFTPAPLCEVEMLHAWNFNALPSGDLSEIQADVFSVTGGSITISGNSNAAMDRTPQHEGTELNAMEGTPAGRALRVRNPTQQNILIVNAPSTGHRDIGLSFAAMRTNNGPDSIKVEYTTDPEQQQWIPLGGSETLYEAFKVEHYDLEGIPATYDLEHLAFRIKAIGPNAANITGNFRLDNIRVEGRPIATVGATLCEGETGFVYEGITYGTGDHILTDPLAMDCSTITLVRVRQTDLDTLVTLENATLTSAETNAAYQWIDCATMLPIANANEFQYTPLSSGEFAVELDQDGCTATSNCHFSPGDPFAGITVHPVPADELLYIMHGDLARGAKYQLFDVSGRAVQSGILHGPNAPIDVAALTPGAYLLRVSAVRGMPASYTTQVLIE